MAAQPTDAWTIMQALSAPASVLLTAGLVWFAGKQFSKMEGQRKEMEAQRAEMAQQREEMVRAREGAVKPYIHVTGAHIIGSTRPKDPDNLGPFDPELKDFVVAITIRNVGTGPALSVRSHIDQDRFECLRYGFMDELIGEMRIGPRTINQLPVRSTGPVILQANTGEAELHLLLIPKKGLTKDQTWQITKGELWIEYRGLLEKKKWRTTVPLHIWFSFESHGTFKDERIAVQDQDEGVREIKKFSIEQDK